MVNILLMGVSTRCGSTLVQRIFNENPETLIWGENGRVLTHFYQAYLAAKEFSTFGEKERGRYFSGDRDRNVFIANMNPSWSLLEPVYRHSIHNLFNEIYEIQKGDATTVGFKEVGHRIEIIDFLKKEIFPELRIYLILRNPFDCWRSNWKWGLNLDVWMKSWYTRARDYIEYSDRSGLFWYEDIICDSNVRFRLAEAAEVTIDRVNEVIDSKKIGGTPAIEKLRVPRKQLISIRDYIRQQPDDDIRRIILKYSEGSEPTSRFSF